MNLKRFGLKNSFFDLKVEFATTFLFVIYASDLRISSECRFRRQWRFVEDLKREIEHFLALLSKGLKNKKNVAEALLTPRANFFGSQLEKNRSEASKAPQKPRFNDKIFNLRRFLMKRNLLRHINFDSGAESLLFEPLIRFLALKTGSVDFRNNFFVLFLLKI